MSNAMLALLAASAAAMVGDPYTGVPTTIVVPDVRLTLSVTDHDVFSGINDGATRGVITATPRRLFFEDHDKLDLAYATAAHLMARAELPGSTAGFHAEVALAGLLTVRSNETVAIRDGASYLKLYRDVGVGGLILTAFPFNADRMRLGYSYAISWGDRGIFRSAELVPGLRVELNRPDFYAHLGAKATSAPVRTSSGSSKYGTLWGALGGLGWDPVDALRLEANGGYFYRGTIDQQELVPAPAWTARGISGQVTHHIGMPVGVPVDFRIFENDPFVTDSFFAPETYGEGLSYAISGELSVLSQDLQDPDTPTSTTKQRATAGDVSLRVKLGRTRLGALFVYRDPAFILFNVPALSFVGLPSDRETTSELSGALFVDRNFEALGLTAGLHGGVRAPASYESSGALTASTVVVSSEHHLSILDPGEAVRPVVEIKASALAHLSHHIAGALEVLWTRDPNQSHLGRDADTGVAVRIPTTRTELGFNFLLRGRF